MSKGKTKYPEYPTEQMDAQIQLSRELSTRFLDMSDEQQQWARDLWTDTIHPMMERTSEQQIAISNEQLSNARQDRQRYKDVYQPLEDNLIQEFQDYDTPERRDLESGRAMALTQQTFDAQRANAEQRLASYGIDPSQLRAGAIDASARTRAALAQAAQGNQARTNVEDRGRALRAEAINIGRGLPSQVAASYGQTLNAGNSAMGNTNAGINTGANIMGTGAQYGSMAGNQNAQTMSGINNMYSGQLAGYNSAPDPMGALGNIAGQAFGAWAGSGFAEGGGAVGSGMQNSDLSAMPGPNDNIPVTLAEDEYIFPKDVVMRLGTEKLDKLIESTRKKAAGAGGQNAGVQPGQMPNPESPIKGQTLAAEGGGAVGTIAPMAVPFNVPPPMMTPMEMSDPFAGYNQAALLRQQEAEAAMGSNMGASIQAGSKMRENYDEGKGLPGKFRTWRARRTPLTPEAIDAYKKQTAEMGAKTMANIPKAIKAIG